MMIVPPEGPTNSPLIAIVGEAPGVHEELARRPFVGPSGFLLDQMLSQAGICRADCYITNVSKVRPPANNFAAMYYDNGRIGFPTPLLCDAREQLWQELKAVSPKVIVALGAEALRALTPHASISNYRGTMIEHFGMRILPTYHPAYLLRGNYGDRSIVECDLRKALRQATTPSHPVVNLQYDPTFEEVIWRLRQRPKRITLDIETVQQFTRMIGIAWSKHEAMSVPLMKGKSHAWTPEQEAEILTEYAKLLASPDVEKVIQNMMYDVTVLGRELGLEIRNIVMDTMLAQHLLYPELPKGLDFLSSVYTDHPMYWGYDSSSHRETAEYNCLDCIVTFEAAEHQERELRQRGLWDFFQSNTMRLVDRLLYVQSKGVLIDLPAREAIKAQTEAELEDLKKQIRTLTASDINPFSPKQVAELVYRQWKLPEQRHPKTKKATTDDDALSILARKFPVHATVINAILGCRQKRVLISNFCEMALRDNRVFTSYNVGGTVTSRLSSSATPDGIGGNLQNIPRGKFRRIFKADPGKVLIKADLSQAEYRVLIWKARIRRVIERWTVDPKWSIHMWNASENIYRVPLDQVTKTMYDNAKNGVYGSNYGIGYLKVSRMYNIETKEAKFIIDRYHEAVPEIRGVYQREIQETVQTTRKIVNPLGRERVFHGRMDDELFRAAFSHYCQSTVADLINYALIELVDDSFAQPELGLDVLLQVHDEIVCQANVDQAERAVELIRRRMERAIVIEGTPEPLVIPAGIKLGENWYDMEELSKWKEGRLGVELPQIIHAATP